MEYELCKELKDAGFPQRRTGGWKREPTLSELIEACGEDFGELVRIPNGEYIDMKTGKPVGVRWKAYPTDNAYYFKMNGDCDNGCCGHELGETPESAVARLWLVLNKK